MLKLLTSTPTIRPLNSHSPLSRKNRGGYIGIILDCFCVVGLHCLVSTRIPG